MPNTHHTQKQSNALWWGSVRSNNQSPKLSSPISFERAERSSVDEPSLRCTSQPSDHHDHRETSITRVFICPQPSIVKSTLRRGRIKESDQCSAAPRLANWISSKLPFSHPREEALPFSPSSSFHFNRPRRVGHLGFSDPPRAPLLDNESRLPV